MTSQDKRGLEINTQSYIFSYINSHLYIGCIVSAVIKVYIIVQTRVYVQVEKTRRSQIGLTGLSV